MWCPMISNYIFFFTKKTMFTKTPTPVSHDKSNFIFFQTYSTKTSSYKTFLILNWSIVICLVIVYTGFGGSFLYKYK
jgi:hypothetical protein